MKNMNKDIKTFFSHLHYMACEKDVHIVGRTLPRNEGGFTVAKCGKYGTRTALDAIQNRKPTCRECLTEWAIEQF